ncbi:hypothetical protein J1N35_022838 [Gossypium stocksii]|uniref:Uncharacterized protein n=1 Tax=Gossypium stocksii TaxID=47602 RepID=A0A9D4A347_9ROSI|nr:hypothetical protein J1N35_022838 [Gossypium stocksii]
MKKALIVLSCMEIYLALREEQLVPIIAGSILEAKRDFKRWDHSNCLSLMILSTTFQKPVLIPITDQEVNLEHQQDNDEQLPIHYKEIVGKYEHHIYNKGS